MNDENRSVIGHVCCKTCQKITQFKEGISTGRYVTASNNNNTEHLTVIDEEKPEP